MAIWANLITRFVTYSMHVLNWSKLVELKLVEIGNFSEKGKTTFPQLKERAQSTAG